jgi:hypothetical protein
MVAGCFDSLMCMRHTELLAVLLASGSMVNIGSKEQSEPVDLGISEDCAGIDTGHDKGLPSTLGSLC